MSTEESRFKRVAIIVHFLIILLTFIAVIPILFSIPQNNSNSEDFQNVNLVSQGIELKYDDGNKKDTVSLPYFIKTDKPFEITLKLNYFGNLHEKSIGIYTSHTEFYCIIDGKVFYENILPKNTVPYSGGGLTYYVINLPHKVKNPKLTIKFVPKLKYISEYRIDPIHIGKRTNFFTSLLYNDWMGIVLSGVLVFLFFTTIIISSAIHKDEINSKRIMNIGILSLIMSVYFAVRFPIVSYLFSEYRSGVYFIEYVSFLFFSFPVLKLLDGNVDPKFNKILDLGIHIIYVNFSFQIVLTLTNTIEFKEMLLLTYIMFFITFSIAIYSILRSDPREYTERWGLLMSIIPISVNIFVGALRYTGEWQIIFSLVSLCNVMFFVGVQVYYAIDRYFKIQRENIQNKVYEEMIMKDPLTDLGSRYAFEEHLKDIRMNPRKLVIMSVDLNNLKEINDTLGHVYGDRAIISVGNLLKYNMPESKVYRIGGDEYVVICEDYFDFNIENKLRSEKIYIDPRERKWELNFAMGYCVYNKRPDMTIDDALKESDQKMYANKQAFKARQARLKKQKELQEQAELKKREDMIKATELKKLEKLRQEELRNQKELKRQEERRRLEEFEIQMKIRTQEDLKKKMELKRQEELKRLEEIKKKEMLERQEQLKRQEQLELKRKQELMKENMKKRAKIEKSLQNKMKNKVFDKN